MRQLRISKQPSDPAWATDNAHALPFLQQLAAAQPLGLPPAEEARLLRHLVAVARQARGQGASWESLLMAGYEGAIHCLQHSPDPERLLAWWVRQGILRA